VRIRAVSLVVIIVSLLAVTACGSSTPPPAGGPASGTSAVPAAFTAPVLAGGTFDGASLAGRPAVLWFWAPWCGTCAGQAETVRGLADTYQGRVTVLGVAGMGKVPEMNDFVKTFKLQNLTHLADEQGAVYRRFGITQQSTYALLDASGKVLGRGPLDNDDLAERVKALAAG
jgi:thiol-disulfide isomerase/thioredoxin